MAALVSTFESASRFEGANESSVQATMSTNAVALSYRTFSLAYLLVDYAFGPPSASPAAIAMAATRTVATARAALSGQAAAAPPKQLLLTKPVHWGCSSIH